MTSGRWRRKRGSAATESEVSQVIDLIRSYEAVFAEGCIIDAGQRAAEDVKALGESQTSMLETAVTRQHPATMRDEVATVIFCNAFSACGLPAKSDRPH